MNDPAHTESLLYALRCAALLVLFVMVGIQRLRVGPERGFTMLTLGLGVVMLAGGLELCAVWGAGWTAWPEMLASGLHIHMIFALYMAGLMLIGWGVTRWTRWLTNVRRHAGERDDLLLRLQQQQVQLRESHRVARLGYWVADPANDMITDYDLLAEQLGLADAAPMPVAAASRLIHPEDRHAFAAGYDALLRGGGRFDVQVRVGSEAGGWRWHAAAGVLQADHAGRRRVFGLMQDIDAAKRAEIAAARQTHLLQTVIDAIPCVIVVKNAELRYVLANAYARRLYGARESMIGRRLCEVLPGPTAELGELEDRAVLNGHPVTFRESTRDYGPGQPTDWLISKLTIPSRPGGRPDYLLTVSFDITPLKHAEAAAQQARREVEHQALQLKELAEQYRREYDRALAASRAKSDFLANMSHELRTPLNAVIGFSEIISGELYGAVPPKYRECGEDILASGRHLLSLINDILDTARIEAGHYTLDIRETDAEEIIAAALRLVRGRAAARSILLEQELGPGLRDLALDGQALKQIALNLLTNAIKFTPPGGRVKVSAVNLEGGLLFCVRDTGIGIRKDYLDRIFEPFWQAEGPLARRHEGTGLGLAITRQLVMLHHGEIGVESEPGNGTLVRVLLRPEAVNPPVETANLPAEHSRARRLG